MVSAFNSWCPLPGRVQSQESFVKSIITWSLCGHRLDQICELEIEPTDIERYIAAASQLRRLRTIVIAAFDSASVSEDGVVTGVPDDTYSSTVRLVEALQHHHGKDLVQDCRFSPHKASHSPEIAEWDAQICMKLPSLLPGDLKLAHPPRPMDSYLSRLVMLTMFEDRWCDSHKPEMLNDYSEMPIGTILQRCRSLIYLNFTLDRSELGGATMFAWAAHEAKEREAGRLLALPVALEDLRLSVDSRCGVGVPRILTDAMRGFALTLCSLYVDCTCFHTEDFGEDHKEDDDVIDNEEEMSLISKSDDSPIVMQKLNSFGFESDDLKLLDPRLFQFCPKLTSLSVHLSDPRTDVPSKWPVLHLPCLTQLMLFGRATILFDEASFHCMPRLETISLGDTTGDMVLASGSPVLLDFWTWDWHLPELTYFTANLVSSRTKFSFRMLRCFPKLAKLCLDFRRLEDKPTQQIEPPSNLPNVADDNFPSLAILDLRGSYILQAEVLQFLLGPAFPSLREFGMEISDSCTVEQVLALTQNHPSLENVKFLNRDNFPDEAMQRQLSLTLYDNGGGGASVDRSCSYTFEIDSYKSATYILK